MTSFYDIDRANVQLEKVRPLLERLRDNRDRVAELQRELVAFRRTNGNAGHVDDLERREAAIATVVRRMERAVAQLEAWDVVLRDISSGLIDFPALVNGRPIWLCWRLGEPSVDHWHRQDEGFTDRRPMTELPGEPGRQ